MITNVKIKYIFFGLIFVFSSIALLVSCLSTGNKAEAVYTYDHYLKKPPDIRVLLHKNIKEIKIEINRPFCIEDFKTKKILANCAGLIESVMYISSGEFRTRPLKSDTTGNRHDALVDSDRTISISTDNGYITLNESSYCGKLILVPENDDRFSIVEEIGIEEFLPGVLEGEMPIKWKDDALQAQIIAARTYAIYQRKIKSNTLYHIDRDDLAYNGSYRNRKKIRKIVNKSRGTIMVYDWKLFPGYFHSTCGGHTEDINLVFHLRSIPPLRGVDCGHCNNSKYYHWEKEITKEEIEYKLNRAKANVKNIRNITTENIGPGGHCSTIKIEYSGGTKRIDANAFRLIVGPNNLRSTSFNVKNDKNSFIFEGTGWGHGVGLCQYGAQDMAKSGLKWFDILRHYYPEIDIVKIY